MTHGITQPDTTHEPADHSVLNQDQLASIRGLDPLNGNELVERILQVFLDTSVDLVRQIEQAEKSNDAESLYHAAHALKSSSANIGAENLAAIAKKLEHCGRSGEVAQIKQLLDALQQHYQRVTTEIKKLLNQS
ncbi:Hpt domain-containing protein [Nitrosomonas sp.]|uniref:Hpt domain-containing protein n=1 Tax=Nitrosomonas sp. TaxID=42353 RepID=UPI001DBD2A21|nr:Hpt domain-containing protein [Nitrosomonas sp.]MCB1947776.1 Hpt domain-containing protein [Nitrosomonas sp.]MDR4513797.1 Hpt domain-containing protein [Nitrosomonas sp.]